MMLGPLIFVMFAIREASRPVRPTARNCTHCTAIDKLLYTHGTAPSLLLALPKHTQGLTVPPACDTLSHLPHIHNTRAPHMCLPLPPAAMATPQLPPHGPERPVRPSCPTHHRHTCSSSAGYSFTAVVIVYRALSALRQGSLPDLSRKNDAKTCLD